MKKRFIWTFEAIEKEALKYNTRAEFKRGAVGAYLAVNKMKRLDEVCNHMETKKIQWTETLLKHEALKYNRRGDFAKGSSAAYSTARRKGLLNDICSHMEVTMNKWSKEEILQEALKYCKRVDFKRDSPKMYDYCVRKKWLDDIDIPMVHTTWTTNKLHKEALKYNTASDFIRGSHSAYQICQHKGILKEMCSHMEISTVRSDNNCVYIWRLVGELWNDIPLYKMGVTSVRLGEIRFKQVAKSGNVDYDIVVMKEVDNARAYEKELLTIGTNPNLRGFDGATEVRALTDEDLKKCLKLLHL